MSTLSRFMGETEQSSETGLIANTEIQSTLAFQILFPSTFILSELGLTKALRQHPLAGKDARVEIEHEQVIDNVPLGLIGWGDHVIQLMGFDEPMPADIIDHSLQVSYCDQQLKTQAREHKSHILLQYAGYDNNPYAQYDALAIVAGVLADIGALVVVNLRATSCLPAHMLSPVQNTRKALEDIVFRILPSTLYCGFIKYFIEGEESLWVRTVGADALYLPDLAAFLTHKGEAEEYLMIFSEIHMYIQSNEAHLDFGHTMQIGPDKYAVLRAPTPEEESFLDSEGIMLVIESCSEFEYRSMLANQAK